MREIARKRERERLQHMRECCSHKVREIEKGERERVCGSKKEREIKPRNGGSEACINLSREDSPIV